MTPKYFNKGDMIVGLTLTVRFVTKSREIIGHVGKHRISQLVVHGRGGRNAKAVIVASINLG